MSISYIKSTGDKRSIEEIEEAIKQQMTADFAAAQKLLVAVDSTSTEDEWTVSSALNDDPVSMLRDLRQKITQDFPDSPRVSCAVRQVHASLQEYLSPAFYLTPAIDSYLDNVIYINPAEHYQGLELYTTLAHEGYPGHLYQSVYFQSLSPDPLAQYSWHRRLHGRLGHLRGNVFLRSLASGYQGCRHRQKIRAFTLGLASLL